MIDREIVERWTIVDDGDGIPYGALSHIGEYVRYRDYAALSARVAELEKERDALAERDKRIRAEAYRDGWVNGSNGVAAPDFPDAEFDAPIRKGDEDE